MKHFLLVSLLLTASTPVFAAEAPGKTPVSPVAPVRKNPAVIPATQKGNGYDWMRRHEAILKIKDGPDPDLVFLGDSISHFWGGNPTPAQTPDDKYPRFGDKVLGATLAGRRVLNLGFGSDRTQQMIWRLDHGELEGLKPKWVVILAGTNNTSEGQSAEDIMAGSARSANASVSRLRMQRSS